MSGRTTPSGIPSASGRMTPSGRTTPSGIPSGRATPSGIPGPRSSIGGIPQPSGRSTPSGNRPGPQGQGRRESYGLASPYTGSMGPKRDSLVQPTQSSSKRDSTVGPLPSPADTAADGTSVQVALRIRPAVHDANVPARFQRIVVNASNPTTVTVDSGANNAKPQRFTFDRVYGPDDGQASIWDSVDSLIGRFLQGYNVTVFAYGQTSSGKSYTMGTDRLADPVSAVDPVRLGIVPRAVKTLFSAMDATRSPRLSFSMRNSYIEIYNEDLIDLLASASSSVGAVLPQVQIREDKDGRIIWSGLREEAVRDVDAVMDNLERGSAVRQTNSTDMNAQSSRSHAIFSLSLTQKRYVGGSANPPPPPGDRSSRLSPPRVTSPAPGSANGLRSSTPTDGHRGSETGEWVTVTSKLHFVDLAGSERLKRTASAGERIKEGISINSGLHALGNVISALGDPSKARTTTHIPYRDSKLTRLLQDSLGGNAHTLMIACVSPTEFNLGETLNTLKYANRARNIKNRAEVNEVEAGWDDVEHLQAVVIKLRKELAYLRSGNLDPHAPRPLSSIDEESGLSLRADLSELQNKYAKALADLAVAQQPSHRRAASTAESAISQSDFEGLIQPVVEEYEKSITALESQLALTRAALSHSEESMKEHEEKLAFEQQVAETNSSLIGDLKSRLAKLAERDALNEGYIRDLEAKLKLVTDKEDGVNAQVAELRKEVARYKESEGKAEAYIKDLEHRFGQSEEAQEGLRGQVDALEREVARREAAYKELEERVALLDTSDQQKLLLQELDVKERKVLELEQAVDRHVLEKQAFEREKARLEDEAREADVSLQGKIKELEERAQKDLPRQRLNSGGGGLSPRSLTPPTTPADELVSPALRVDPDIDPDGGFADLQRRYDALVAELDDVNAKYKDALKELEDLSKQVEEARLISTESSDRVPFPSPCPSPAPLNDSFGRGLGVTNAGYEEGDEAVETLAAPPTRSSSTTPTTKSPRIRRSMPITHGRISFLGAANSRATASPVGTPPASHVRSLSLSQELSSAPLSLSQPRGSVSLLHTPTSDRSVSPVSARWADPERSQESLRGEIMKLQETLREREEEINDLERSLHELKRGQPVSTGEEEAQAAARAGEEDDATIKLTPSTSRAFDDLKAELAERGIDAGADDQQSVRRLDDLMRSMAKKESDHVELISDLKDKLAARTRQHEDLEKLARDQVVNMSTEIDALRNQLSDRLGEEEGWRRRLEEMDAALVERQDELRQRQDHASTAMESLRAQHDEALASREADHASAIRGMQEEHAEVLRRMVDEREALFVAKTRQYEEAQHAAAAAQEAMLATMAEEHERAVAEKEGQHAEAVEALSESHRRALADLVDQHGRADGDKMTEAAKQLEDQQAAHVAALEQLRKSNEEALGTAEEAHRAATREMQKLHDEATGKLTSDHDQALEHLRSEKEAALAEETARTRAAHEKELEEARAEHEEILVASLTELDARRSRKHDAAIAELTARHEAEVAKMVEASQTRDGAEGELARKVGELQEAKAKVEVERDLQAEKVAQLTRELDALVAAGGPDKSGEAETELREALDTLAELDKALTASHAERDALAAKLDRAKEEASAQRAELDKLRAEKKSVNGRSETPVESSLRSPKPPPPTPPPSVPPPPVPTTALPSLPSLPSLATLKSNGAPSPVPPPAKAPVRTSNGSSTLTRSNSESAGSGEAWDASTSQPRAPSLAESVSMDPRVMKKIEEQEAAITKLTKQLTHCENDLKANIELVANLESALNDSERNLRKSRLQMKELAKERDKATSTTESLREQLAEARSEVDDVRHSVVREKASFDARLDEERRAKEVARRQLESRLEEMQSRSRKSKFNCF